MSFLVYFFVLLVAASSVLFGLDWMHAPLQPPPSAARTMQTARVPVPATNVAETRAQPASQAHKVADATPAVAPAPTASAAVAAVPASAAATDGVSATETTGSTDTQTAQAKETAVSKAPLCDVSACERSYHTFTPIDCTYQPYGGPRRLCTKGAPPGGHAALLAANESRAQANCNVSACASAYGSFDAATCTYQPYDGPRRLCTK
jgi:hypothetical protein